VILAFAKALGAALAIVRPKASLLAAIESVGIAAAKLILRQHAING